MSPQLYVDLWDALTTVLFDLAAAAYISHSLDRRPLPKEQPYKAFLRRQALIWQRAKKNWPDARRELFTGKSLLRLVLVGSAEVAFCLLYPSLLRLLHFPVTFFACLRMPMGMLIWSTVVLILLIAGDDDEDSDGPRRPCPPQPRSALTLRFRRRAHRTHRPAPRVRPKAALA